MSERDTDFEFDFFDEPETREGPPTDRAVRPGPRGPVRPPENMAPLLRLVGLVAFAILIVVLLVVLVGGCGESKASAARHYMEKVGLIASTSNGIGRQFNDLLTTPGIKPAVIEPKLVGLAEQEKLDVASAQRLKPPGSLRLQHQHLIDALALRVSGLQRLADAFSVTTTSAGSGSAASVLADQARRLVASDVIWRDLFQNGSLAELKREGIGDVTVPDSTFVLNSDLASSRAWVPVLQRIKGASTGGVPGGLHGTGLVSVFALPKKQQLNPAPTENTVIATPELAFSVTVQDTGDSQEVQIPVTLTIQQSPKPIVKKLTIDQINPTEQKTLVFRNLGPVQFATKTTVKVEVQPVPGEKNISNNSAEYPVIFSLG